MSSLISLVCRVVKAGQGARRLARYIASKSIELAGDLGFGEMPMDRSQLKEAADLLRADHGTSRASEVRHIIFSAPLGTPPEIARPIIRQVAHDWIATYAPGHRWMLGLQNHNGKEHGHLEVQNVGEDGSPIQFKPHQVVAMAAMKFTSCAVSAKDKGLGKSLPVYPKSANLAVRDLAALLVDDRGGMRADVWAKFVREGVIGNERKRKDGTLISFEFSGRRMRLTTLRGFLQQQHSTAKGGVKNATNQPQQRRDGEHRRRRDSERLVGQRYRGR